MAAPLRPPLPFLVERLLSAAGPFGLEVEIKSEHRVVGTWAVEVNLRGVGDAFVSQAQADLYVCGSARGDPRATGAFLVVRQWSVGSSDSRQLEQLYAGLSVAALERLDSLLGGVPNESGAPRECVLYLVDARRAAAPVSARPAAGSAARGAGRRASDRRRRPARRPWARHRHPAARPRLDGADAARRRVANPARAAQETTLAPSIPVGEVFVAETVSPENLRWNRRASDKARALLAAAEELRAAAAEPEETR